MTPLFDALLFAAGLAAGAAAAWLAAAGRAAAERARLEERASRVPALEGEVAQRAAELGAQRERVRELETTLADQTRHWEEKAAHLQRTSEEVESRFKALAGDVLKASSESFLALAQQRFEKLGEGAKGDLEKRQAAFEELVKPVRETLAKLDEKVQRSDKERDGAHQALLAQLKSLGEAQELVRGEAHKLVQALRAPNARGRWGEIELRRIVEHAGMTDQVSFVEQSTHGDGERVARPDLVVKLPNGRSIVVDAKVPLAAYLDAIEATDDATRAARLKEHAAALAFKIDDVAKKDYSGLVEGAIDVVVLFLPAEGFVRAAFEADSDLMEKALQKGVVVATPMTLIALLKAVAYGWRQESLAKNAQEVSNLGAELYDRLAKLAEHFARVGRGLEQATHAYNDALGTLEGRVLASARKMKELGATKGLKELEEVKPVEAAVRSLTREELLPRGETLPLRAASDKAGA